MPVNSQAGIALGGHFEVATVGELVALTVLDGKSLILLR
jgi:hypothetical protein